MIIIYPDYKNRITLHALNRINNSDMINYIYLALAIVAETVATTALKISEQFTRLWPSLTAVIGYAATFYLLSLSLRTIPIGVAYVLWGAIGIVLIAIVVCLQWACPKREGKKIRFVNSNGRLGDVGL